LSVTGITGRPLLQLPRRWPPPLSQQFEIGLAGHTRRGPVGDMGPVATIRHGSFVMDEVA
jgi:hypothetical protein